MNHRGLGRCKKVNGYNSTDNNNSAYDDDNTIETANTLGP